jgi:TonB-linked SusC/RagA family outer membrane protein
MRITLFLMVGFLLSASANSYSQNTRLNIKLTNGTVTELMKYVEDNSEFVFLYKNEDLDLKKKVTVELENATIQQVLDAGFNGQQVGWDVYDRQIVIHKADKLRLPTQLTQQQRTVTGVVTDQSGQPLPGVTVMVPGTTTGTVTSTDGNFSLAIPDGAETLQFSFVGMRTQEVPIEGRTTFTVVMEEETIGVDEVVVVGYGTQRRENLSGSVDQVNMENLESRSISNISQGLQGLIPNLNIDYVEGAPGADARINIRGYTSINEGDPLILIDGIPSSSQELTRLEPQDVASISVLKDASSAAIYGARAAFGVILIETKRGVREGINVRLSSRYSWDKPTILPEKTTDPYIYMRVGALSTQNTPWEDVWYSDEEYEWARQRSDDPESAPAVRVNPNNPNRWQYMGDKDWNSYFLADFGTSTNHTLSVDGRTEKTSYYLSASFDRQDGVLKLAKDRFDRYSIRSRVDYRPFDWLTIGNNTVLTSTERLTPSRLDQSEWSMWDFYIIAPTDWDKNPDGTWANTKVGHLASKLTQGGDSSDGRESVQTRFTLVSNIVENIFTVNADYTVRKQLRNYNYDNQLYTVGYGPDDIRELGSTYIYRNRTTYDYHVANIYGNLNLEFGNHRINSLLGFNQEHSSNLAVIANAPNLISSKLPAISLATGTKNASDSYSAWAVRGVFYRLNYIYNDRYIFEVNGRYDGSSRFPKDSRFGFFPSGSVAWRIDKETFMQHIDWLEMFKLRGSYGALGNQSVSPFGYIPSMNAYRPNYITGDSRPLAISAPGLVSSDYTWEKVFTQNFGVDVDLFDNKLMAVFDIYKRETIGMLTLGKELPAVLGASEPRENAADLETKGWELSLTYRNGFNVLGKRMSLSSRFILSDNSARITKFDNPEKFIDQYYEGMELGEIWGFEVDGLFQTQEEIDNIDVSEVIAWGVLDVVPGWPRYKDLDGDKIIKVGYTLDEPNDMKIIGNSSPRYRYGFNFDMDWNNFDFRVFFQGVGKKDYYPKYSVYWSEYYGTEDRGYKHTWDFYRAEDDSPELMERHSQSYIDAGLAYANTDAKFPHLQAWLADARYTPSLATIPTTEYMLNGAYLRLKNVTLGYTLPSELTQRININRLRIYFSGENIAEWSALTDYFDPEAVTDDGYGYRYPFSRRYSIGVNIDF